MVYNRYEMPSSRAFTNRLNTLASSNEELRIEENPKYDEEFVTVDAVTPGSQIGPSVERYLNYSKEKENQ